MLASLHKNIYGKTIALYQHMQKKNKFIIHHYIKL